MLLNPCYIHYAKINVAEHFTQPVDYFDFADTARKIPISVATKYLDSGVTAVIAGGGGIYGEAWKNLTSIAERLPSSIPLVVWGMGINDHDRLDRNYPEELGVLESKPNVMLGLRDTFYRTYVPCASCMRPEFDARFATEREIGLYVHQDFNVTVPYPTMSNRVVGDPLTCFWRVLKFLGSCDVVVTNTYHGAYWATLLNRRVIVVAPFSNKFFGFRHEPVMIPNIAGLQNVLPLAKSYPTALTECRAANRLFYERVLAFQREIRSHQNDADRVGRS
jgi:hypothetical protein